MAVCFWYFVCCIVGCRVDKKERTQVVRMLYPPPPPPLSVLTNVVSIGRHSDVALRLKSKKASTHRSTDLFAPVLSGM